jgi:hypothetical protein
MPYCLQDREFVKLCSIWGLMRTPRSASKPPCERCFCMGHGCDTLVHRGWSEVDCPWCCEPDGQFDRDAQRNHQLLLRAREAESFCCGCLTSPTYGKEDMAVRIIHERVAGLDVHKKTVVATRVQVIEDKRLDWKTKTFGTTTPDLLALHAYSDEIVHVFRSCRPLSERSDASINIILSSGRHGQGRIDLSA